MDSGWNQWLETSGWECMIDVLQQYQHQQPPRQGLEPSVEKARQSTMHNHEGVDLIS